MNDEAGDQTRGDSTAFLDGARTAALSQGEVGALCLKAARGAGMSWGLAEEAAYAAVWLVRHGFDGPRHLHLHLAQAQDSPWSALYPIVATGRWEAERGQPLCPIALGATLCDHAALPEGLTSDHPIRLGPVDHPVLLIPFLHALTERDEIVIALEWADGTARLDGDSTSLADAVSALSGGPLPLTLTARRGSTRAPAIAAAPSTDAATIAALNALAMRTTVPASDASRAGAGSATPDND